MPVRRPPGHMLVPATFTRTVEQHEDSLAALKRLDFTAEELAEIDRYATDGGVDLWKVSSGLRASDVA